MDSQEIEKMREKKHKRKLFFIELFLVFIIIIFGLSIYILSYQRVYAGKIYPNIQFTDINIGGKSRSEAITLLENYQKKVAQQKLSIKTDDQLLEVTFADAGADLDIEAILGQAFEIGRDESFFSEIFKSSKTIYQDQVIEPKIKIDNQKFSALIEKISSELNQKATDATINISGTTVSITAGKKGMTIDKEHLVAEITKVIDSNASNTIITKTVYSEPEITENNLTTAKAQAEKIISKKISFSADQFQYQTTNSQIGSMISFIKGDNNTVRATADNNKIASFVANTLAKKYDVAKVNRKISATNNAVISEGTNGRHLDRNLTSQQIEGFLNGDQTSITITLSVAIDQFTDEIVFPNEGIVPGRFPGKYIDVDLANQQLYLFEGQSQVGQFVISSGKWSMPTPTGTRYIDNKNPKAWSAKYGLYMPYWQSIGGGYGIHELPEWPNGYKEGENHLGIPVSHGCIRLGVGPAQTVYNWTEIGIPVYIHNN
jgi:hypothetical protein